MFVPTYQVQIRKKTLQGEMWETNKKMVSKERKSFDIKKTERKTCTTHS